MIYVYKNSAGETREIQASMKNPPPEVVMFYHPYEPTKWTGLSEQEEAGFLADNPSIFRRDYSNGGVLPQIDMKPGGEVNHPHQKGKPPTSCQLPYAEGGKIVNRFGHQCREIKPGLYATMEGRRIIDSKSAGDRHAADCGYVRTRDE